VPIAHSAFEGFIMPATTHVEFLISKAYVQLSAIPKDSAEASVSLASIGSCEIRMFLRGQADGMPLLWLELFDHGIGTSVDSFRCHKIEDAAPVFEELMSQAAHLNKEV
jgi:hypothetical protein